MVNINIALPEELHKELKVRAALDSKTLKELIIEILELEIKKEEKSKKKDK